VPANVTTALIVGAIIDHQMQGRAAPGATLAGGERGAGQKVWIERKRVPIEIDD